MQYENESVRVGPLTRSFNTMYSELMIQNNTKDNIIAIDSSNNHTVIPPVNQNQFGRETVIVWYRSTTEQTVDQNNNPLHIDGHRIIIPKHELNSEGGCYIPEINTVLCTEAMSIMTTHPRSSITYMDASEEARASVAESIQDAATIKLVANDPDGRYNKLYTVIGDMTIEIQISNVYGEAVLQIMYFDHGKHQTYEVELDEFFNSADDLLELKDLPISFVTTNKARAARYAAEYKRVPQSEVEEMLKKAATRSAKDINAIKEQYDTDIKVRDNEIKRLKDDIKTANADKDDAERKYTELKAAVDASNIMREHDLKEKEINNKGRISDNNVTISDTDTETSRFKRDKEEQEAKFKTYHLVIAAAVPTVAAVGMKLLDAYIKSKTNEVVTKRLISKLL